jgi:hypothetical protein
MPNSVDGASAASAIAALIRQAVSGQVKAKRLATASGKANRVGKSPDGKGNAPLADLIAARAGALNLDASDYRGMLLRLVVEASLLHEFGSNLLNAPKFQYMVDQVLHELQSAPQLKADVHAVVEGLAKDQWPSA